MDNLETLATLGRRETQRRQTRPTIQHRKLKQHILYFHSHEQQHAVVNNLHAKTVQQYSCISFIQDAHARLCKCNPYTSEKQMKSVRYQNVKSRQTRRNVYYLEHYIFKSHSRVTRWVPHVEQDMFTVPESLSSPPN